MQHQQHKLEEWDISSEELCHSHWLIVLLLLLCVHLQDQ